MSQMLTQADTLSDVTALVRAGALDAAKNETVRLLDSADEHTREIIGQCTWVLANHPRTALTQLRQLAQTAVTDDDAELIRACTPDPEEYAARPETQSEQQDRAPRWDVDTKYQAPREESSRSDPAVRRTGQQRRQVGQAQEPRTTLDYFADRAEPCDERIPEASDGTPDGYSVDYDAAAVRPLRGEPCVFCWLERGAVEIRTARMRAGYGDDGLCTECRDRGYTAGIPVLPQGHTRAAQVTARCAYIAERFPAAALRLLAREWQRATRCDPQTCDPQTCTRHIIAGWVDKHHATLDLRATRARCAAEVRAAEVRAEAARAEADTTTARTEGADAASVSACKTCRTPRHSSDVPARGKDDRLCTACRNQSSDPAAPYADIPSMTAA